MPRTKHLIIFFIFAITLSIKTFADEPHYFIALSDIHFDPFTQCHQTPCPQIEKLAHQPVSAWPQILNQYDLQAPKFRQDTNYALLLSSLSAARKAANSVHAKFVMVLGDSLGHEFYTKYKKYTDAKSRVPYRTFVYKVFAFLTETFKKTFVGTDVYLLVGNNDSYQGNYVTAAGGAFFADAGALWSQLIYQANNKNQMQKQFAYAGYYAVDVPEAAYDKLIMLNTVIFSYKAKGKNIDSVVKKELAWLHAQLSEAQKNNQKVFIAMHIPEGIDVNATPRFRLFRLITLWKPEYVQLFQRELQQFAPVVTGIFAGHLHTEVFQLVTLSPKTKDVPFFGVPSISPIFGTSPSFQIYAYDTPPLHVVNFLTYRASQANYLNFIKKNNTEVFAE